MVIESVQFNKECGFGEHMPTYVKYSHLLCLVFCVLFLSSYGTFSYSIIPLRGFVEIVDLAGILVSRQQLLEDHLLLQRMSTQPRSQAKLVDPVTH